MPMKALSVKNPYAPLIVRGNKRIEVRSKRTNHRGEILICTSLTEQLNPCFPIPEELKPTVYGGYRGYAIGTATIVDCRPFEPADESSAFVKYKPGLWAWVLSEPKCIMPFKVKGQLGLFDVNC